MAKTTTTTTTIIWPATITTKNYKQKATTSVAAVVLCMQEAFSFSSTFTFYILHSLLALAHEGLLTTTLHSLSSKLVASLLFSSFKSRYRKA